ncbi:MAG TPA: cytochrome c oxidase subunit 3 [Acidimicrobiales bacterium]|nr:cytochrome c oxidase subunit 3 [Acidimicrobiales bacterium]
MSTTTAAGPDSASAVTQEPHGGRGTAWWGMAVLIMTEATIFASLLSSYFFLQASSKEWPLGGIEAPELSKISLMSVVLLGSSGPMFWAEHGIRKGQVWRLKAGLIMVILMGLSFFCFLAFYEYPELTFGIKDNAYASIFYMTTALHGAHVVGGLLMLGVVLMKAFQGKITAERHVTAQVVGMYWHFVDVVWIFVFSSLYLSAHIK